MKPKPKRRIATLADFEAEQSDERFADAAEKLRTIEEDINRIIFDIMKLKFGPRESEYWDLGVPENKIKAEAYGRSLEDDRDKRGPIESYLNLIDYKRVVEHRQNWSMFKDRHSKSYNRFK